ncbi:hypothetical protein IWW38_004503, partial [Coemansia aciculifera]
MEEGGSTQSDEDSVEDRHNDNDKDTLNYTTTTTTTTTNNLLLATAGLTSVPRGHEETIKRWADKLASDFPGQPVPTTSAIHLKRFLNGVCEPSSAEKDKRQKLLNTADTNLEKYEAVLSRALDRKLLTSENCHSSLGEVHCAQNAVTNAANADAKEMAEVGLVNARAALAEDDKADERAKEAVCFAQHQVDKARATKEEAKRAFNDESASYDAALVAHNDKACCLRDYHKFERSIGLTTETRGHRRPLHKAKTLLTPSPNAAPSTSAPESWVLPTVKFSNELTNDICDFWSLLAAKNPELLSTYVDFADTDYLNNGEQPWYLPCEQAIDGYFIAEMEPSIREILRAARPEAEFRLVPGNTGGHSDLFLQVRVKDKNDQLVYSSVAVELKQPYGANTQPTPGSVQSPEWAKMAQMPSSSLAAQFAKQLYRYAAEGSLGAPKEMRGSVNPDYAIASTYNMTWIIRLVYTSGQLSRAEASTHPTESSERPKMLI